MAVLRVRGNRSTFTVICSFVATGSPVSGQNNSFIPHKGVFSEAEKSLYVSYANGAGPYDGTAGYIQKVRLHL